MSASTPAQRTLTTARCLLAAGALVSASAIVRSSIAGTLLAWLLMLLGGGMLVAWLLAAPTDPPSRRRLSALFPCPPGALEKLVVRLAHGAIVAQRERIIIDLILPGCLGSDLRLPVVADPHRQVGPFVR